MPFKQGRKPSVVVSPEEHRVFRGALLASGYKPHTGPFSGALGVTHLAAGS